VEAADLALGLQERQPLRERTGRIERHGAEIILEAEEFWIPAEVFPGSDDRRELSVTVKDANLTS
jgi:hypothetical protein